MTPKQAVEYLHKMTAAMPHLSVAGISGPGEPFAAPDETLEALRLVRADFPEMLLCVATNGLNAAPYIQELIDLNVTHITITVNAVNPKISEGIYAWVRHGKKVYRGLAAAEILLSRQLELLHLCRQKGLTTKINSILIPGINEYHIPQIAETLASQGADLFNCTGMCSVQDTPFASIAVPSKELIEAVRKECECFIPQMRHCMQCRADAAGLLGENLSERTVQTMQQIVCGVEQISERPYAAVATMEGFFINQHIGRACEFYVYGFENDRLKLIGTRKAPPVGARDARWKQLSHILNDCQAVFTSQAGAAPLKILQDNGIKVIQTEGY
jgi:nitrogen fixation protein NifB